MVIYFTLDDSGYVNAYGSTSSKVEGEYSIELASNHEFFQQDPFTFKFVDDDLVQDKEYAQQRKKEKEQEENKLSVSDMNTLAIFELAQQIEDMKGGK